MSLKRGAKNTQLCMPSNEFFSEDSLQDNHWVGHLVMKLVDVEVFHKIKALRECNDDKSENFEMKIIYEGVLYKALEGHETTLYRKKLEVDL